MGGQFVLATGEQKFSRMGAKELITFSLPSFNDNFKADKIVNKELLALLKDNINRFENFLNQ
jgi:hypothetical protein